MYYSETATSLGTVCSRLNRIVPFLKISQHAVLSLQNLAEYPLHNDDVYPLAGQQRLRS